MEFQKKIKVPFSQKIITTQQELSELIKKFNDRKDNLLGFTNGCFDLLHEGHVTYLEQAAFAVDFLIVGLNTDNSVRNQNKGKERPIHSEMSRARVLASLESVDWVILFEENTPLNLIQQIKPDILIKGADYTLDQIVGAKEVLSWKGKVKRIEIIPNQSTTQTIKKIKNQ